METTTIETSETRGAPLYSIRWTAIFAGLAVGLGVHLLLMLIGIAAGFAVLGAGGRPEGQSISIAAALWNTVSMLISAMIGGYVAARASGLRRSSDGMLHGVVSWGATMLVFVLLTSAATGGALTGMFGLASTPAASAVATTSPESSIAELFGALERGDRQSTVTVLQQRFGLTADQAQRAADQALTFVGQGTPQQEAQTREGVSDAAQAASVASAWLSAAILLSLLAAAGGGLLGARAAYRRSMQDERHPRRVVTTTTTHATPPPSRGVPTAG